MYIPVTCCKISVDGFSFVKTYYIWDNFNHFIISMIYLMLFPLKMNNLKGFQIFKRFCFSLKKLPDVIFYSLYTK